MELHKAARRRSSTAPPKFSPHEDANDDNVEDDNEDQYDTPNLGDGSQP